VNIPSKIKKKKKKKKEKKRHLRAMSDKFHCSQQSSVKLALRVSPIAYALHSKE